MTELQRGDVRRWTEPHRRDPHTVLRVAPTVGPFGEVAIKYADKTTAWEPLDYYLPRTEPV